MFQDWLLSQGISFEENVPLSKKSWIKTGGTCTCWVVPESAHQLKEVCGYLFSNNIHFDIVGQTSNIFFHSSYSPKVVVSTVKVNHYDISNGIITCDCGVNVARLSRECVEVGYKGFYGLVGLPGTVAASVYGNAGCFDCSIVSMLVDVEVLTPEGQVKTFSKDQLGFSKRSSAFKRDEIQGVILSVRLKIESSTNVEDEKTKAESVVQQRKRRQEGSMMNLGSVYSKKVPKKNLRNICASGIATAMAKLKLTKSRNKLYKKLLLSWYGYQDLMPYISDKTINTFVWKDEKAENMFERYKRFMTEIHKVCVLEIEERE